MRVPLMNLEKIHEEGAVMMELFGRRILLFRTRGKPEAFLRLCPTSGGATEEGSATPRTGLLSPAPMGRDGDESWELVCPDMQLIALPTLVEDGMLTYVYGD